MSWINNVWKALTMKEFSSAGVNMYYLGTEVPIIDSQDKAYFIKLYETNPDFYAVVSKVLALINTVPIKLYKGNKIDREEVPEHEILELLDNPNQIQGGYEFKSEWFLFYLVTGDTYMYGYGPDSGMNAGKWDSLHILPSDKMRIKTGGWRGPISKYILQGVTETEFNPQEILHKKAPNMNYDMAQTLYGMSPAKPLHSVLKASTEAYWTLATAYINGGVQGFLKAKEDIDQVDLQRIANSLRKRSKAGMVPAVNKDIDYVAVNQKLSDLELLESIDQLLNKVCNAYGISSILLNNNEANTYNNYGHAKKSAYTEVIKPLLMDHCNSWTKFLCNPYGDDLFLEPDFSDIEELQENFKEKADVLRQLWQLTPNQVLEEMGFDTSDDPIMDQVYIPANLIPVNLEDINPDELAKLQKLEYWERGQN